MCWCDRPVQGRRPRPSGEDSPADSCYSDKGPIHTRMGDIARRAGVHRSTVYYYYYYYFPSKAVLLAASFVRVVTVTQDAVELARRLAHPSAISSHGMRLTLQHCCPR
nr:TetR/AcrR family transcriptional regulator [Mycobacterium paraffinicum]